MAFFDSSALVPLCTSEMTSIAAGRAWKRFSERAVWCETVVELESAIARLRRQNSIDDHKLIKARKRLNSLLNGWEIVRHSGRVIELARTFPSLYSLKAADSLQLASALAWCKEFPNGKDFVSADKRLLTAAEAVGFTVHDLA